MKSNRSPLSADCCAIACRAVNDLPAHCGQSIGLVLKNFRDGAPRATYRQRNRYAAIQQQAAHLAHQCSPVIDKAAARPMQGLNVLLLLGLGRHELHVRQHQGGADGLCIVLIILLMLDEWFDILRRDHLDRMAERFELPLPKKRPSAGLNANDTGLQLSNLCHQSSRRMRHFSTACPSALAPCNWNTFWARSIPTNATVISLSILLRHTRSVADGGRDTHPIKWRAKYWGMEVSDAKKLKALEAENAKLKKLLAEQMMDVSTLKEMLGKNL